MGDAAAAAAPSIDPSAGAGVGVGGDGGGGPPGFDPSGLGGTSPDFGMGPFDPNTGLGAGNMGDAFGSFAGPIPGDPTGSIGAQQAIQGPQALNQPPLTDQPQPTPDPHAASQTLPQSGNPAWLQKAIDVNHALWHGPTNLSGVPGDPAATANATTGATRSLNIAPTNYGGGGPAPLPLDPADPATGRIPTPQPRPPIPTPQPRPPEAPAATPPAATPPAATPPAATPPAATPPAATPPAATPPAQAGMGGMGGMGSPLEQLVGQFIHMILGGQGGIGSMLEQMIDHALGINPQRLLTNPQQAFNPPPPTPGSGYLPAGATGGRPGVPGSQQASGAGTGTPPPPQPRPPGPPGSPGNQPLAITPRGAENHPQAPDGTPSPGARQAGSGGQNTTGVPDQVIQLARQWAMKGGPAAVFQFMQDNKHPRSGAWCGEFAAAVMHSQGISVPKNPEIASNWRTWGNSTLSPKPGDIAVRKGVPTGATGSHVTMVTSVDPARGTVTLTGGNQGNAVTSMNRSMREWDFRTLNPSNENLAQARTDQQIRPRGQQQPQRPQQPRRPSGMTAAQRHILNRRRHRFASDDLMEA